MEKIYPMIHISADLKGFRETSQGRELSFVQSRRSVASSFALTETYVIWIRGGISIETESATLGEWNVTLDFISFATLTHEIERWPAKRNRREKKKSSFPYLLLVYSVCRCCYQRLTGRLWDASGMNINYPVRSVRYLTRICVNLSDHTKAAAPAPPSQLAIQISDQHCRSASGTSRRNVRSDGCGCWPSDPDRRGRRFSAKLLDVSSDAHILGFVLKGAGSKLWIMSAVITVSK